VLAPLSLIAVLLALQAAMPSATAVAEDAKDQGLAFQDVRQLKISLTDLEQESLPVTVCNLDAQPARGGAAAVVGFGFKDDEQPTADTDVLQTPVVPDPIAAGGCVPVTVAISDEAKQNPPDEGVYDGVLVVTSAGAGSARRDVQVTVGSDASTPVPAEPWRILPKPTGDFSVGGINFVPSLLNPVDTAALNAAVLLVAVLLPFLFIPFREPWQKVMLTAVVATIVLALMSGLGDDALNPPDAYFEGSGPSEVHMASPAVDTTAASGAVGSLIGKDGFVAMAVVENDQLVVEGIPRAGAYAGQIDLLPDDEAGAATLTANVRDWWPYALLPIAAGVLLGAWLTRYFTVERPRQLIRNKSAELREKVIAASCRFWSDHHKLYGKYSVWRRMKEKLAAIEEKNESPDAEDRKQAAADLTAAQTYFEDVRGLWRQLPRLSEAADSVERIVDTLGLGLTGEDVPSVVRALELLNTRFVRGGADADSAELKARRSDVDTALARLEAQAVALPNAAELRTTADAVTEQPGWSDEKRKSLSTHKDALHTALNKLITATSADDVRSNLATLSSEAAEIFRLSEGPTPPRLRAAIVDAEQAFPEEAAEPEQHVEIVLAADGVPLTQYVRRERRTPRRASELTRRFMVTERQMTTLAGVLAVGSGLLTLYFPTATWGGPGDYLKAILWGSVVSEGIKYVTSLVGRVTFTS
jgi:hypothetical protein